MTIHTSIFSWIEKNNCDCVKHCTYFGATFVLCLKGLEWDKILDLPEDAWGRINDWVRMWKSRVLNGRLLLDKWSPVHGCPQILMRHSPPPSRVIHRYNCLPVPQLDLITTTRSELCTRPHISKLFKPQQGFHSPKPGLIPVSDFSSLCWCKVGPFVFPIHGQSPVQALHVRSCLKMGTNPAVAAAAHNNTFNSGEKHVLWKYQFSQSFLLYLPLLRWHISYFYMSTSFSSHQ